LLLAAKPWIFDTIKSDDEISIVDPALYEYYGQTQTLTGLLSDSVAKAEPYPDSMGSLDNKGNLYFLHDNDIISHVIKSPIFSVGLSTQPRIQFKSKII